MAKKIKKNNLKISIPCTECFRPTHLKFNFSFITYEKDFNDKEKLQLLKRIRDLSKGSYLVVANYPKEIGFENIKVDIKKEIDPNFCAGHRTFDGKYTIIRLYPNNNSVKGRIIGKLINKVFYIFFIDVNGVLYEH